jgi:hypothetical protein
VAGGSAFFFVNSHSSVRATNALVSATLYARADTVRYSPPSVVAFFSRARWRLSDDAGEIESEAVEDAVGWVELPDMTAMLLERLHSVHLALDSVSLRQALKVSEP